MMTCRKRCVRCIARHTLQLGDESGKHPAQRRLILEELLAHNQACWRCRAGAQRFMPSP